MRSRDGGGHRADVTRGSAQTRVLADDWTVVSLDGSRAAHFEHTVAVSDEGLWVLTALDGGQAEADRARRDIRPARLTRRSGNVRVASRRMGSVDALRVTSLRRGCWSWPVCPRYRPRSLVRALRAAGLLPTARRGLVRRRGRGRGRRLAVVGTRPRERRPGGRGLPRLHRCSWPGRGQARRRPGVVRLLRQARHPCDPDPPRPHHGCRAGRRRPSPWTRRRPCGPGRP